MWQWYYKAETWQDEILFIALQEVILKQAKSSDNIYDCILEQCRNLQ